MIDVTLAWADGNSKLVEVVTVVDVDDEDRVGKSLLQIWKLRFGLELKNRILKSIIKVGCPLSDFPILSDFLTGRKPLLLWSF